MSSLALAIEYSEIDAIEIRDRAEIARRHPHRGVAQREVDQSGITSKIVVAQEVAKVITLHAPAPEMTIGGRSRAVVPDTSALVFEDLSAGGDDLGHVGEVIGRHQETSAIARHLRMRDARRELFRQTAALARLAWRCDKGARLPHRDAPSRPSASIPEALPRLPAPLNRVTHDFGGPMEKAFAAPEMTANLHPCRTAFIDRSTTPMTALAGRDGRAELTTP